MIIDIKKEAKEHKVAVSQCIMNLLVNKLGWTGYSSQFTYYYKGKVKQKEKKYSTACSGPYLSKEVRIVTDGIGFWKTIDQHGSYIMPVKKSSSIVLDLDKKLLIFDDFLAINVALTEDDN